MRRSVAAIFTGVSLMSAACEGAPKPPPGTDADTIAWWSITGDLSADEMEGRDTGSPGYDRAARYVADRFRKAGLKPAGESGTWLQALPLKEVRVEKDGTRFDIVRSNGSTANLRFLHQITIRPTTGLPAALDAPLSFRGYCSPAEMGTDMKGKVAVCFSARRRGMPSASDRLAAAATAGAAGLINVDNPGFIIEPARWPEAYARSITFKDASPPALPELTVMRLSAEALDEIVQGTAHNASNILKAGAASEWLPSFDIPARIKATFTLSHREFTSDNVLALLPGSDPALGAETIIVSAHLDGYGYGEPVAAIICTMALSMTPPMLLR